MITQASASQLAETLRRNDLLWECLERLSAPGFSGWFVGAGCIAQTVWNSAHDRAPAESIRDYDLAYFDPDLSAERETEASQRAATLLRDLPVKLDVKNQARVHLWYAIRFGYHIRPYSSIEEAIASWPTTATAVGVRQDREALTVVAPFGLSDVFDLIVRPNRVQITPEIYESKAARWISTWPRLRILTWEEGVGVEGERRLNSDSH